MIFKPIIILSSIITFTSDQVFTLEHVRGYYSNFTSYTDTTKKFKKEGYPVTSDLFSQNQGEYKLKKGRIFSLDKVWFTNVDLNQTLVILLHTDDYRLATYHFLNSDVAEDLINRIELHIKRKYIFDLVKFRHKKKYLPRFIKSAKIIDSSYFTTTNGLRLGDSKSKILKLYGESDNIAVQNGVEKYEWRFEGDLIVQGCCPTEKPVPEFSQQAILLFRNDKLIGILFHND